MDVGVDGLIPRPDYDAGEGPVLPVDAPGGWLHRGDGLDLDSALTETALWAYDGQPLTSSLSPQSLQSLGDGIDFPALGSLDLSLDAFDAPTGIGRLGAGGLAPAAWGDFADLDGIDPVAPSYGAEIFALDGFAGLSAAPVSGGSFDPLDGMDLQPLSLDGLDSDFDPSLAGLARALPGPFFGFDQLDVSGLEGTEATLLPALYAMDPTDGTDPLPEDMPPPPADLALDGLSFPELDNAAAVALQDDAIFVDVTQPLDVYQPAL